MTIHDTNSISSVAATLASMLQREATPVELAALAGPLHDLGLAIARARR